MWHTKAHLSGFYRRRGASELTLGERRGGTSRADRGVLEVDSSRSRQSVSRGGTCEAESSD